MDAELGRVRKERSPETAVAKPMVSWLEELHWDVYQEVAVGSRADIVGLQGRLIWVVEVKTTLTLDVIEQAQNWLDYAHYVSIAVPWSRSHRGMAQRICKWLGIGMFEVESHLGFDNGPVHHIHQKVQPRLGRSRIIPSFAERLRNACVPECKTYSEAGSARGGYFTPFKNTCNQVTAYLKKHGPSPIKDVMQNIQHHYASEASARASVLMWVGKGKVKGIEVDWSVRPAILRLTEKAAA